MYKSQIVLVCILLFEVSQIYARDHQEREIRERMRAVLERMKHTLADEKQEQPPPAGSPDPLHENPPIQECRHGSTSAFEECDNVRPDTNTMHMRRGIPSIPENTLEWLKEAREKLKVRSSVDYKGASYENYVPSERKKSDEARQKVLNFVADGSRVLSDALKRQRDSDLPFAQNLALETIRANPSLMKTFVKSDPDLFMDLFIDMIPDMLKHLQQKTPEETMQLATQVVQKVIESEATKPLFVQLAISLVSRAMDRIPEATTFLVDLAMADRNACLLMGAGLDVAPKLISLVENLYPLIAEKYNLPGMMYFNPVDIDLAETSIVYLGILRDRCTKYHKDTALQI